MSPADVSALLLENNRLSKGNMDLIRYNEMLKHQLSQRQDHILEIQNAKVRLEMRLAEFGEFLSKHRLCFFNDTFCRFLASKVQKCADIFHSFFKEIRPAASCLVVSFRLVSEQNENPNVVLWDGRHTSPAVTSCPLRDRAGCTPKKTVKQREVTW